MKQCTKCGGVFDLSYFGKRKASKDGLRYECKGCQSKQTKAWRERLTPLELSVHYMANGIHQRGKENSHKDTYEGVENRIGNMTQIRQYLIDNFKEDIELILDAGEVPSVDRIDSNGHYEDGNIQIISQRENSRKRDY